MISVSESIEKAHSSADDVPWQTVAPGHLLPVMSFSVPAMLLGMHVINGVLGTFQLPPFIQTVSKQKPSGKYDRLSSLPESVINVDNIKRHIPGKHQLKPEKLCKRLGDDFDSFWMSIDLPEDYPETHIKHKVDTSLKEQLNMVNFTALEDALYRRYDKTDGGNKTKAVLDLVKDWMVQKSSCPVYYRWEDLGFFYWPRWVRRGMCSLKDTPLLNTEMSSKAAQHFPCSWPPGMHCVPGRPKQLSILTLQCRRRKGINHFHRYEMPRRSNSPSHSPNVSENRPLPSHTYHVMHADLGWDVNRTIRDAPYTKPVLDIENKLDNSKRVSARRGKGLKKCKESIQSKTEKIRAETRKTSTKSKVDSLLQRKPQGKHTTRKGTRKDDDNDTGNWRSASWEAGRQGSNLRCKWIKIPYPVTDDCFCSC